MAPPTRIRSAVPSRLPNASNLSVDLRAAEHHHVRPPDAGGQPAQRGNFGLDQVAGRVRQPQGDVVDAGVLAVHGAEAVPDVQVGQPGELIGEQAALHVVLAGLRRVEAQVLQHDQAARAQRRDRGARGAVTSVANSTGSPSSSPSRAATGASEYLGSGLPAGRPR